MGILGSALTGVVVAALTTVALVPLVIRLASAVGSVDHPGDRRSHSRPTPRLGGVAIFAGIVLGTAAAAALAKDALATSALRQDLLLFGGSLAAIFLLGVLDDIRGARVWLKLSVEVVVATIVVLSGWAFQGIQVPFAEVIQFGPVLGTILSIVWLVGITNAINLVDGLDGLAGGITAIIGATLTVFAVLHGDALAALITAAMTGACLGFLRFNWAPARIFMGDSGSLTLGFLLASVSLHSSLKSSTAVAILVPFLALGLPAIDTLLVMMVRFAQKPKGSFVRRLAAMFNADRNHLHHVLLDMAPRRHRVVLTLYVVVLAGCLMAFAVVISRSASLGYALIAVEVAAIVLIRVVGAGERAGAKALSMRERALETIFGGSIPDDDSGPSSSIASEPTTEPRVGTGAR